jgi:hypothetical protein
MDLHFITLALGEGDFSWFRISRGTIDRRELAKIDSETTQTMPARVDCRTSAIADMVPNGAGGFHCVVKRSAENRGWRDGER